MKNQRILFEIAHPKHFHQFKGLIEILSATNEVHIIARHKDVVIDLLKASGFDYETYGAHGKSLSEKIILIARILRDYRRICKKFRPTLVISKSSPYAAVMGKMMKFKTCIMNDSEVVALTNRFVAPLTTMMITPPTFPQIRLATHRKVNGLFEESYLHPDLFNPKPEVLSSLGLENNQRFVVMRYVGWYANHDVGRKGFTLNDKIELCALLEPRMKVFISNEGTLPFELEKYRLPAAPEWIHSVLHYADLYIGDSQTMATEAALLGTPSIRFNSFVGEHDMANFKYLEQIGMLKNADSFDQVKECSISLSEPGEKQKALDFRIDYFHSKSPVDKEILSHLDDLMAWHL